MYKILTIGLNNLYVVIKAEYLKFLYDKLKNEFLFVRDRIAKYYNKKLSTENQVVPSILTVSSAFSFAKIFISSKFEILREIIYIILCCYSFFCY